MVLKPSDSDFKAMVDDLANGKRQKHEISRMPEQDYLTRFYANKWYSLGVQFNYQPHQIAFTDRSGLESCRRLKMDYEEEVHVVHFSAVPKPPDWILCPEYHTMTRQWFALRVLFEHYLRGIWKDRKETHSKLCFEAIGAQLRRVTLQSTMEWFQIWDRLLGRVSGLSDMVQVAVQTYPKDPRPFHHDRPRSRSRSRRRRMHKKKRMLYR